jgi:thioredoxin reductase (NADPH)
MQKAWLSEQGIEFTERNIVEDPAALDELQKLNIFSTPATLIDGELVIGFDRAKFEKLLGIS